MISTPVRLETGLMLSPSPVAGPFTPNRRGMDGPVMSASSTPALKPRRRIETASMALVMLLPTPPLPETTPMTFWIRLLAAHAAARGDRSWTCSCCNRGYRLRSWYICSFKNCSFFSLPKIAPECKTPVNLKAPQRCLYFTVCIPLPQVIPRRPPAYPSAGEGGGV